MDQIELLKNLLLDANIKRLILPYSLYHDMSKINRQKVIYSHSLEDNEITIVLKPKIYKKNDPL
jgi:hypothetical protein